MKVLIATCGTRGDVEPFLALGEALAARGHTVAVAADDPYRGHVERAGFAWVAAGEPTTEEAYQEAAREAMREADPMARAHAVMERWLFPRMPSKIADLERVRGEYDLLVVGCLFAVLASRCGHDVGPPAVVGMYMPAAPDVLQRLHARGVPTLFAWNRRVMDVAVYETPSSVCTGYWFRAPRPGTLAPDVAAFLDRPPPTIAFTFGSMTGFHADQLDRAIGDAMQGSPWQAIVHRGNGDVGKGLGGVANVMVVDEMDVDRLFPHVAGVVHHGGSGTTAQVVRHGKPSVVIPVWGDQPMWADALALAGVSGGTLDVMTVTGGDLTNALRRAFTDREARARDLMWSIAQERGAMRAAELCESIAAR